MSHSHDDYVVEIDLPAEASTLPCACGSCEWRGTADKVTEIEECSLTPGDPSPVGRCPEADCNSLVYLDRPQDRAQDAAEDLLAALEAFVREAEADRLPSAKSPISATTLKAGQDAIAKAKKGAA